MARYDRAFLVPYLNNICVLHLSKLKASERIAEEERKIEQIKANAIGKVSKPEMEVIKQNGPTVGSVLLGVFLLMLVPCMMLFGLLESFSYSLSEGAIYFIAGIVFLFAGCGIIVSSYKKRKNENATANVRNAERQHQYEQEKKAALDDAEPFVREAERKIDFYREEIARMDGLLKKLYDVNVIPRWYRDLYPAVYLDDWFSNGRSDDLEMALNTFVLEEIKEKVDVVIKYHAQGLINQRIMIANQVRAMEQQERHHRELMSKLDEMQTTSEERNAYLQMIEANTATSAFFDYATYLKD